MQKSLSFCERYGIALIPICLIILACGIWPEMELLVPSLPDMKRVFGVQDAQIQQLLTANFMGFLIGVLFAGPLCDSMGRKSILVIGSVGYLLASFLGALAPDFSVLMLARFLQGIAMTGPIIAGGVLLLENTTGASQVFWMSLANAAITFCMAIGPIAGSWVNTGFGYQGNLWCIVILGLVGILPSFFFVSESLEPEKKKSFHISLLFKGYFTLLKDWRFMSLAIPMCSLAAAYFVYVGVSALYMVDYLGIEESAFGRYQGPIVGCFSIVSLSSAKLMQRFGLMRCIKTGAFFMCIGSTLVLAMSLLAKDHALYTTLFMMLFVGGMAPICGLLFPYALSHLPAELQGNAQAMIQAIRLFFTSLGTCILGFVYDGPLLPVACIMSLILWGSLFFLWKARAFIKEDLNTNVMMSGH